MENYRPQLFLRTADITVSLKWPEGTTDAAEKMVMPGDNTEMVCDLVHDAAAEVGTRFTLREGGKTSEYLSLVVPTHDPHGRSQLEPVLSQNSSRELEPFVFYRSTRLISPVIRVRALYKSCYCLPLLILPSPVLCYPPLTKSRNIASDACIHTYIKPTPITYPSLAMWTQVVPRFPFRDCLIASVAPNMRDSSGASGDDLPINGSRNHEQSLHPYGVHASLADLSCILLLANGSTSKLFPTARGLPTRLMVKLFLSKWRKSDVN